MPGPATGPLMLIHGAWLTSRSWENFTAYFKEHDYTVSAPEWPRKHGDVEEIRGRVVGDRRARSRRDRRPLRELVHELDSEPILVGHSFGGLVVEILSTAGSDEQAWR